MGDFSNTGLFVDQSIENKVKQVEYQVCESGTQTCSDRVVATW
jgi:hypothetical protein